MRRRHKKEMELCPMFTLFNVAQNRGTKWRGRDTYRHVATPKREEIRRAIIPYEEKLDQAKADLSVCHYRHLRQGR
jgi:hypothetical protein